MANNNNSSSHSSLPLLGIDAFLAEIWDAVLITDSELASPGPRITYANHAFLEMTGYTEEELLGQSPRILQGPETDQSVLQNLKYCIQTGQYFEGETWNYKKDGTPYLVHWKITPLKDQNGHTTHYIAIQRDTTNWRKGLEQVKQSEERYRKLLEFTPAAILVHQNGIIKYANNESARLFKAKNTVSLIGEDIFKYLHPDYRQTAIERVYHVQKQGVSVNLMNQRFVREDGEVIDVESIAIPFNLEGTNCVQSILKDITQQKKLESLLEETQDIAEIGGWSYDIEKDQLHWTKKIYDIFEVSYDENIDIDFALSYFPESNNNRETLRDALNDLIANGKPFDLELRFQSASGRKLWVHALGKPYYEAEALVKVGGTFQNITEEKEAQLQRDRMFEYSLDMIMIASLDGILIQANPQVQKLLGWEISEMKGQYLFDFLHPDDQAYTRQKHKAMVGENHQLTAFENRIRCKDGTYKWLSWNAVPMYEEQVVYGFARDITEQKEYEEDLVYNETLLSEIFHESIDALFLVMEEYNTIQKCNKTAVQLFEADDYENLIGLHGPDLHKDKLSRKEFDDIREGLSRKQYHRGDYEMRTLKGNTFWASVAFKRFELQGVNYELISIRDVTERIKASEELLEKQAFIEKITEHSPSVINIFDYSQKAFIYTNRSIVDSLGYKHEEKDEIKKNPRSICHPDDIEKLKQHRQRNFNLKDGEVNTIEYRVKHKSGHWVWLLEKDSVFKRNNNGSVNQVMGVVQDTTEQKYAEESLRHNEALFRQLFQNAPVGIVMVDQNDKVESVNKGFEEIFGYTAEEVKQKPLNEIIVPTQYAEEAESISQQTMEGFTSWHASYRYDKEGNHIPVLIYGVPVFLENETKPVDIFGIYVDISERKQIEDELKQQTKELLRSNAELEQFAYVTSHNLRSPVVNIKSLIDLFSPDSITDPENRYLFHKISDSVQQLDTTLNDLVNIVAQKQEVSKPKQLLHFDKIFEQVTNSLENQIEEAGAEIYTDFSNAPSIYYLRSFLVSILQNLLTNALKYRSSDKTTHIEVNTFQSDGFVCLTFADNGIGIDLEKYENQIFTLYKQFHSTSQGKGMGLYIIKSQVESLGGYVKIDSKINQGTTFRIYLKDFSQMPEK